MTTQVVPFLFETTSPVRTFLDEKGNPWFCAKDVCEILGYTNTSKTVADHCREKGITNRETPSACEVTNRDGTSKARKSQEMTYIDQGNLYRLIARSRKPEAEKFESWVFDEVIPSIHKTGSYSLSGMASLSSHTVRANQLANSKAVNRHHIELGGRQAVIAYNMKNCTLQSGKTPSEWKLIGKQEGMTSRQRESAKNVLRIKAPQVACGMSLADELVNGSVAQDDAISVGKDAQPIFQRILALGFTPPELLI